MQPPIMTHLAEQAFMTTLGVSLRKLRLGLLYHVSHNKAKFERHFVDREETALCVHRKGATHTLGSDHLQGLGPVFQSTAPKVPFQTVFNVIPLCWWYDTTEQRKLLARPATGQVEC